MTIKIASASLLVAALTAISSITLAGTAEKLSAMRAETASQKENAVVVPAPQARVTTSFNKDKNVYFGDTHVHTALSFDAYLSGNRMSLRDAYRFADGEPLTLPTGETMQLTRPLDFVVMADHAEAFGLFVTCEREDLTERQVKFCQDFDAPSR